MKKSFAFILLAAVWITACSSIHSPAASATPAATPPPPIPHSMKGYELYSWQTQGQWHFTLITGTNRQKSLEEITAGQDAVTPDGWVRISVLGADVLKVVLSRLPRNEEIFWVGPQQFKEGNIAMPPPETIALIVEYCRQLGLTLTLDESGK